MSNAFWDYSLASYGAAGVAPACIALQDEFSLDVNILLYAAWLASLDQSLEMAHLQGIEARVAAWRDQVVRPLRALRRQWRGDVAVVDIRDGIKALELQAERRQQDMMLAFYHTAAALPRAQCPMYDNLALVAGHDCRHTNRWKPPIRRLASRLGGEAGVAQGRSR